MGGFVHLKLNRLRSLNARDLADVDDFCQVYKGGGYISYVSNKTTCLSLSQ